MLNIFILQLLYIVIEYIWVIRYVLNDHACSALIPLSHTNLLVVFKNFLSEKYSRMWDHRKWWHWRLWRGPQWPKLLVPRRPLWSKGGKPPALRSCLRKRLVYVGITDRRSPMKVKVQVIIESDGGIAETVENIVWLERGALQPENLGLTLIEAKAILAGTQKTMVDRQITDYLKQQACCPHCGRRRLRKGHHILVYRTPFGKLRLRSLRLYHCVCQPQSTRTFSPLAHLLSERTAPELLYLESKFASLMS